MVVSLTGLGRDYLYARVAIADPRSAPEKVFQALNAALYRAKKAGGNRVEEAHLDVPL